MGGGSIKGGSWGTHESLAPPTAVSPTRRRSAERGGIASGLGESSGLGIYSLKAMR